MKKKRNKERETATRPVNESEGVNKLSDLRIEWSPQLQKICLRNDEGELVDDMEETREILIVDDDICI